MSNTIFITANWITGALSQQTISRQYDNNRYAVQFIGYPEGDGTEELNLYLLVWMSTAPGQKPGEITPIQLNSDQWYISNYFTQQVQVIKFQLCVLNEAGTYEAHSPIFSGRIGDSLEHNGTSQDIDVSTLFDAYREYLNELIIGAGAVIIDSVPTQGSDNAVSSGGVYDALQSAGLSEDAKTALLACFEHVAWIDEHGQNYYDALESALYADQYPKITATFNSGTNTIYTDDDISSLKQYLTVKYFADRSSAGQTISANDYTLTGTLTEGTSTIIVAYNNLTTVFAINDVVDFYNKWNWSLADGDLPIYKGTPAFLSGSSTDGILFNNDTNSQKTRRSAYVNRGKLQCAETISIPDDLYPIPIPSNAVKATVSINPSTMQVYLQRWVLQGSVYKISTLGSWTSETSELTFAAGDDAFLCINIRYNSSNAEFASEPQGLTLTFE